MRRVRDGICVAAAAFLIGALAPAPEADAGKGFGFRRKALRSWDTARFVCDGPKCPASWKRPVAPRLSPVQRRPVAPRATRALELVIEEPAAAPAGGSVRTLEFQIGTPTASD